LQAARMLHAYLAVPLFCQGITLSFAGMTDLT
jgi:hypothetical protein